MQITPDWIFAVVSYAFVSSITPGPNNTMLLASGVNFGVVRTVPHLLGVSLGFTVLALAVGFGLHALFARYPLLLEVLRWAGAAYMVYLAWRIWQSGAPKEGEGGAAGAPMGFLAAAAFQWVNVKAVIMAVTAMTLFAGANPTSATLWAIAMVFTLVNLPCCATWVVFGASLRRWLQNPMYLRIFNGVMALGLLLSLYPMLRA